MDIQSYIDRKREAGAKEHEGNSTDWKDWTGADCLAAVAGELLDAFAYNDKQCEIEDGKTAFLTDSLSYEIYALLKMLPVSALEAACREAEAKVAELPKEVKCEIVVTESNDPDFPYVATIKNTMHGRVEETKIPLLGYSVSLDIRRENGRSKFYTKNATIELCGTDEDKEQVETEPERDINQMIEEVTSHVPERGMTEFALKCYNVIEEYITKLYPPIVLPFDVYQVLERRAKVPFGTIDKLPDKPGSVKLKHLFRLLNACREDEANVETEVDAPYILYSSDVSLVGENKYAVTVYAWQLVNGSLRLIDKFTTPSIPESYALAEFMAPSSSNLKKFAEEAHNE